MAATIKDIANMTGLGYATISKYLNGGNVLPENREKINAAVKELNYTVNAFAHGLKTNKSNSVGIIVPAIGNVFVTQTIPVIVDELRYAGYATIICDSRGDTELEAEQIRFLLSKRVDGIINMPATGRGAHLKPAFANDVPVVLIDRIASGTAGRVDAVVVDNAHASRSAISSLTGVGHQKIGIISGPADVSTSTERLQGYLTALERAGIKPDERLIEHSDYTAEGGYRSCKRLMEQNPDMTALYIINYDMTVGAMMAIHECGVKVPEELSVFGFDDMPFAQVISPPLSIVAQPIAEIGKCAAHLLLSRMNHEDKEPAKTMTLRTETILRESVCPPQN